MQDNIDRSPTGEPEQGIQSRGRSSPLKTSARSAAPSPAPESNQGSMFRNVKNDDWEDDFSIVRNNLSAPGDKILVLTPLSKEAPDRRGEDPYHYFAKSTLERRYSEIVHVPYTEKILDADQDVEFGGSWYRGHIMLAKAVIFVVNDTRTNPFETKAADLAYALARDDYKIPFILVLTNPSRELFNDRFSHIESVVQVQDYSKRSLETAVARIFGDMELPVSAD